MNTDGPIARKRALFFYSIWLLLALAGFIFIESCSHAEVRREESISPHVEATPEQPPEANINAEGTSTPGKKHGRQTLEEVEAELDHIQQENTLLREENWWLRTEILKLQESLTEANQNIYSLHRKLDAIFKPGNSTE